MTWEPVRGMADDEALTRTRLEAFIADRRKALAFPPWLERRFESDTRYRRTYRLLANTRHVAIVYNLFLIGDWMLTPDQFALALKLHFFVVTPWMMFIWLMIRSEPRRVVRECLAATLPMAIVAQIACIFYFSRSPFATHYQYLSLLPVLFTNTIQRLLFPYAVLASLAIVAIQGVAIVASGHMPLPVGVMAVVTLAACAYTTLFSNFYLERDFRRSYLHGLRDRLTTQEAEAEARRDALTGLENRHSLNVRIRQLWGQDSAASFPVTVVLLDIDYFKNFNDRYGHPAGDACLKRVAAALASELRGAEDLAVRFGGEEFLLLLPRCEMGEALKLGERVRRAIEALGVPHEASPIRQCVTVSLGVAVAASAALSSAELIAAADAALYAAKHNGRNQLYPPLVREHASPAEDCGAAVVSLRA